MANRFNLDALGVKEMSVEEMREVNGGMSAEEISAFIDELLYTIMLIEAGGPQNPNYGCHCPNS